MTDGRDIVPRDLRHPALAPETVPARTGSGYPEPFRRAVEARVRRRLGDALGLTQFGVNLLELPPGSASSQRHWHSQEDEFVYVLDGEVTLVSDAGEQVLGPGMAAGFPAGKADGHQLINRTDRPARCLEMGTRSEDGDVVVYSDIDMELRPTAEGPRFFKKSGEPY
jgi:uncharacterized cupin superfamily protein